MEEVLLAGKLWRAHITEVESGLMLKGDAREFDQLFIHLNQQLLFERRWHEFDAIVSALIRCPAGEPETWVWLRIIGTARDGQSARRVEKGRSKAKRW